MESDTIVALATPRGRAALALVRLSGPDAPAILATALRASQDGLEPRRVQRGVFHGQGGEKIDDVLAVRFAAPASYTGEDVVELTCHGSPWVVRRVLEECLLLGARTAHPGEFTRRAFLNGKLDLVQAEAVRDLIDSETAYQAELARLQLEGNLARLLHPVREELVAIACQLETALEFVEDDVSPQSRKELAARLDGVGSVLARLLEKWHQGQVIREGARVVLIGCPNSGKSSLFNYLIKEERALVSAHAGTTRDALRELLDLGGVPVWVYDTAGIREPGDEVEELGISRSRAVLQEADLVLFVVDRSRPFTEDDFGLWDALGEKPRIPVWNKLDLESRCSVPPGRESMAIDRIEISALEGIGIEELIERIGDQLVDRKVFETEGALLGNVRQRDCVLRACAALERAGEGLRAGLSEEFVCHDLRQTLTALADLVGETTTDEILSRIFSTFCIGK